MIEELWPALAAAHRWMWEDGDRDGDGFLEYAQRNPAALFHQGWKDGSGDHLRIRPPVAMVEVQGYAYAAHRAFAAMAGRLGKPGESERALAAADRLRVGLNETFWWPEEGSFFLALDGAKHPRAAVTSNPGHLLFTGAIDPEKRDPVVRRLFRDDLWTAYGIRTHAISEPDFDPYGYHTGTVWPHDNWIIYRGLRAIGASREAARIRDALLRAHAELGRIPELYAVVNEKIVDLSGTPVAGTRANPIQAWSCGALLDILEDEAS